MRTTDQVQYEFTPQGKLDPGAQQRLLNIEVAFKDLGLEILQQVPEIATRTIALNHLLMAKMLCSQAITHPGQGAPAQNQQAPTASDVSTKKEPANGKEKSQKNK